MRWSIAKAVTIGLVLLSNIAVAQPQAEESLILSTQCGRFHLVLGRIKLDCFHYKKVRLHQATPAPSEDEEFVCVTANRGAPSLHYLRHLGSCKVTIDTTQSDCVRIESKRQHSAGIIESLLIQQGSNGPIEIVRSIGDHSERFETASFWHLIAQHPELFQEQISPLLSLMIDRNQMNAFADQIDRRLQVQADRSPLITAAMVDRLVDQLASPKRSQRLTAQRELASAGVGILPLLEKLDPQRLDAEQIQLLGKLKRRLASDRSDTPDRVAAWLATDSAYWASVTRRWTPPMRDLANQYMLATCGHELNVDTDAIAMKSAKEVR